MSPISQWRPIKEVILKYRVSSETATMSESFTLTLSGGDSSVLEANYFPPIELSPNHQYSLALVELLTFNSIPNIDEGKNKFYYTYNEKSYTLTIPPGSYEIEDIHNYLQKILQKRGVSFELRPNNNTLCSEIKSDCTINFEPSDSIARLLGFNNKSLTPNKIHISDLPVRILKVNSVGIECNITGGAYINGKKVHIIHEFFPIAPPGYKIVEVPKNLIYLPITVHAIDHLQLRLIDQDGELVNFQGEIISIRLT